MFELGKLFVFYCKYLLKDWSNSASFIINFKETFYQFTDIFPNTDSKNSIYLTATGFIGFYKPL